MEQISTGHIIVEEDNILKRKIVTKLFQCKCPLMLAHTYQTLQITPRKTGKSPIISLIAIRLESLISPTT